MSMIRSGLYWVLPILLISVSVRVGAAEQGGIDLNLKASQNDYVVGEPIKLLITFTNNSGKEIRMPECEHFNMNMEYIHHLEVTTPEGRKQCRRYHYLDFDGIINEGYAGEPLLPGDYRESYLYPNSTWTIDCASFRRTGELGMTFPEAGQYRVRVFYIVPSYYRKLWKVEGGFASNEITLSFREPNSEEREILNAVRGTPQDPLSEGDDEGCCSRDDDTPLRQVIAKYPDNPLIKYAYFYLAKSLSLFRDNSAKVSEAVRLFSMIAERYPDFRSDEVHLHLARSYRQLHDDKKAIEVFNQTLERSPNLIDNYNFMFQKIYTETRSNHAIGQWRHDRCQGINMAPKKPRREG